MFEKEKLQGNHAFEYKMTQFQRRCMLGDFGDTESREADEIRGGGRLAVLSQMASLFPRGRSTLGLYSIFS